MAKKTGVDAFLEELKATGELSDEEFASITAAVAKEKVGKVFESGVLAQSDYAREMNSYKQKLANVTALEAEMKASVDGRSTLSQAEVDALQAELDTAYDALAEVKGKLATAETKAQRFKGGPEFIEETGLNKIEVKEREKKEPPAPAPVTRDDLMGQGRILHDYLLDLDDWKEEYRELTGKRPDMSKYRSAMQKAEGKDPRAVFDDTFGIAGIRAEKAEAAIQARIDAAVKDKVDQLEASRAVPSGSSSMPARTPPLISQITEARKAGDKPPERLSMQQLVQQAAVNEHKIRQQRQESAA